MGAAFGIFFALVGMTVVIRGQIRDLCRSARRVREAYRRFRHA